MDYKKYNITEDEYETLKTFLMPQKGIGLKVLCQEMAEIRNNPITYKIKTNDKKRQLNLERVERVCEKEWGQRCLLITSAGKLFQFQRSYTNDSHLLFDYTRTNKNYFLGSEKIIRELDECQLYNLPEMFLENSEIKVANWFFETILFEPTKSPKTIAKEVIPNTIVSNIVNKFEADTKSEAILLTLIRGETLNWLHKTLKEISTYGNFPKNLRYSQGPSYIFYDLINALKEYLFNENKDTIYTAELPNHKLFDTTLGEIYSDYLVLKALKGERD